MSLSPDGPRNEVALSTARSARSRRSFGRERRVSSKRDGHSAAERLPGEVDNESVEIPVDLAGMPVLSGDRSLLGYRGFGLVRTDGVRDRPPVPDEKNAGVASLPPREWLDPADEEPQPADNPAEMQSPSSGRRWIR